MVSKHKIVIINYYINSFILSFVTQLLLSIVNDYLFVFAKVRKL